MKKCLAIAAFLLASTAAQAQYTFQYDGRTITIDPDRGTVSIPGVYDNTGKKTKRSRTEDGEPQGKKAPQQAKTEPRAVPDTTAPATPAPAEPAAPPAAAAAAPSPVVVPAPTAPAVATRSEPSSIARPADTAVSAPPPAPAAPQVQQNAAPAAITPAPAVAPAPALPPAQKEAAAPPIPAAAPSNSPLGVWLTEEKEGKVRIEQCGANLCGYSVDKKSNQNGEQVLINMKPGKDFKWSGRILDPNTGSTYDSTIAMKGSDSLRVQGCAFGGMFCGGQTWTRVN